MTDASYVEVSEFSPLTLSTATTFLTICVFSVLKCLKSVYFYGKRVFQDIKINFCDI